ncbi:uncharacterized protein FFMR_14622 [Fusarium fujikuroi]|nr:uncharacterized protein FFMR_14622 [Fusarium fujikuroi]
MHLTRDKLKLTY